MHDILAQGMLNCFSGTASKQGTFKAVHDLTELALPTLLLLQCLPSPHLTATKKPQSLCPFLNSKNLVTTSQRSEYLFRRTHQAQEKRSDPSKGRNSINAKQRGSTQKWPCPNFYRQSTTHSEEYKKDTEYLKKQLQFLPLSLSQCDHRHDLFCLCRLLLVATRAAIPIWHVRHCKEMIN